MADAYLTKAKTAGKQANLGAGHLVLAAVLDHPYIALLALSLTVRIATALAFNQPGYMDAYYTYVIAENLHAGKGLTEDFIWNYLYVPDSIDHPAGLYWMPLTSILIWVSFSVFGVSFLAAQVPFVILSSIFVAMCYYVGADIFHSRRYAWSVALFSLFSTIYFPYMIIPDNLTPFAVTSLAAIIFGYKALKGSLWAYAAAGLFIGLSYLTRADGILLFGAIGLAALIALRQNHGVGARRALTGLVFMGAAALASVSPWLVRNMLLIGTPMQPGSSKTVFLREYNDIFTYVQPLDLAYFLNQVSPSADWGFGPIIMSKLSALFQNLMLIGRPAFFVCVPLFIIGLIWSRRDASDPRPLWKRAEYLPFLCYTVSLYLIMSLVFTFPSPRGSTMHSSGLLLPFVMGAVVAGIDVVTGWLDKISRPQALASRRQIYTGMLLAAAVVLSIGLTVRMQSNWDEHYNQYRAVGDWFQSNGLSDTVVMVIDPPGYKYTTGQRSIVISNDSLDTNIELAHRYGVSHLILERSGPRTLADLYKTKQYNGLELRTEFDKIQIYEIVR